MFLFNPRFSRRQWAGLKYLFGRIEMKHDEELAALQAVGATLDKIGTETSALLDKVADLQAAVDNADNVPQDVVDALAALSAQATKVDDLVPDSPAPATEDGTVAPNA